MSWIDGIRVAVSSLLGNRLRSFLTLLGIVISVTAVILVVSVIQGLDLYVADSFSELGPDVFTITKFGIVKNREEWLKIAWKNPDIRSADADAIRRQAPLVKKVGCNRGAGGVTVKQGAKAASDVMLYGSTHQVQEIVSTEAAAGRLLAASEVERAAPVCFLGHDVAEALFGSLDPLGRSVRIKGRRFRVIGVGVKRGSMFGHSRDNYATIPFSVFQKMFGKYGSIDIVAQAVDARRMEDAMDEARTVMRVRHKLRYNEKDDFGIVTSAAIMGVWENLTGMIFNVAIFVVSISLVVGGIVIMNIMLLTVVERTREIGVRKAVGARHRDIRFQFLAESVLLCAVGGLLGVTIGALAAWAVRTYSPLPAHFPLWAPMLAVAVTSIVGVFFGLHPARQAARLDPIEALRSQAV